jgi:group I intron endonuclease
MSSTNCKIYVLTNTINNKIYIGQTWEENVEDRMGRNGSGYHGSQYLFNAIKYHGVENFKYTVLEICFDKELADYFEKYYIKIFNTQNRDIGYNIAEGGGAPMQGQHHTPETKAKISATTKGRKLPPEQVAKSAKSREMPQERQVKIVEAYKSNEFVSKIFETFGINTSGLYRILKRFKTPRRGQKGPNNWTGKQHSPETKAKMSKSAEKLWQDRKENKNE